jgi:hypothetical protein
LLIVEKKGNIDSPPLSVFPTKTIKKEKHPLRHLKKRRNMNICLMKIIRHIRCRRGQLYKETPERIWKI